MVCLKQRKEMFGDGCQRQSNSPQLWHLKIPQFS
jgi:hypothetical protein